MKDKSTNELLNILNSATSEEKFLEKVSEWHPAEDKATHELLNDFMLQKKLNKSYVVEQSGLHRTYGYQILQGKRRPGRDKLLALCLAMQLTYAECQQVLLSAKLGVLYARNRRDAIIIYALQKSLSVVDTNTLLYESSEAPLE